jgi:hypothetical protein
MKAAGIPHKCMPGRNHADGHQNLRPAHMPARRELPARLAAPGAPMSAGAGTGASAPQPLTPLAAQRATNSAPHVLHIDPDSSAAVAFAALLMPEVRVTHVRTLADARHQLQQRIFSAVVIDPILPDGDAAELLPTLTGTPLLVYSAELPAWRARSGIYLAKPWTTSRQLWTTISKLLGIPTPTCAGD